MTPKSMSIQLDHTIVPSRDRKAAAELLAHLLGVVGDLVGGLTTFFVRGSVASLLVWVGSGLVLAWFTTAWALIYRSAWAEASEPEAVDDAPADEPAAT